MNPEEQRYMESLAGQYENLQNKNLQMQNDLSKMSSFPLAPAQNLVEFQLNVDKMLEAIHHILSGEILRIRDEFEVWEEPDDDRMKVLSPYGVYQIMNLLRLYVNTNTLLSYYKEEQIKDKMHGFAIELMDLMFCGYEKFFYYPAPEDLYEKYLPIVKKEKYAITEEELYYKCLQWSGDELQSKSRHFPVILKAICDVVNSAYNRALNGEERESLRKQMHISQNANTFGEPMIPQKQGMIKKFLSGGGA